MSPSLKLYLSSYLIHNAGNCGDVSTNLIDLEQDSGGFSTYCLLSSPILWQSVHFVCTIEQSLNWNPFKAYFNNFFASNLTSLVTLTRDFAKQFTTRNVINISSLIALVRVKKCGLYSASKMARDVLIEHMVQGLQNIKDIRLFHLHQPRSMVALSFQTFVKPWKIRIIFT